MKRACLFFLFASVFLPAIVRAQVQTGTPPFGSFGGGPDVIDLANLNSHIIIPVRHKLGRGLNFAYDITYDSAVWYPVGASGSQVWQPVPNWGWNGSTQTMTGYISYSTAREWCLDLRGRFVYYNDYKRWQYYDAFGVRHSFPGVVQDGTADCATEPMSFTSAATDQSGYTITAFGGPDATVASRVGTVINAPLQTPALGGQFTDRNGNMISSSSSGTFTDTLGTTVLTVAGSAPNPVTFKYAAPNNPSATYTLNYTNYTVATNFGVAGISEYKSSAPVPLVSTIVLPDGSEYAFTYESTPTAPSSGACTPYAGTTCVTARIAKITLPTGGTITYTYSGGNNGVLSDGTVATLTRATPDGTWNYSHTLGSGSASTTIITDPTLPAGNDTVIQFQGIYETQRQVYSGSHTSGTLLQTTNTCYNGSASPCTSTAVSLPITQLARIIQLGTSGPQCEHVTDWNSFGMLMEQDDYDYGNGSPGPLVRKTLITYAPLGNNINAFQQTVAVQDGTGGTVSQTTYNYDETPVVATSGTPQQVSVSGSRGNLTSVVYTTQGSSTLKRSFTYFDTGNVQTSTDVNNAATTYNYPDATSTCGNAFATSVSEPLGLSRSMAWNCNGGVETSVTDENGQATSATWNDAYFWRPAASTDAENNITNLTYASVTSIESSLNFNGSGSTADILATLDGLGRTHVTQRKQSPSSSYYDSVETDYDSLGRPSRVTVPYSGTSGQANGAAPATTMSYDALNRATQTTDGGGGTISLSYTANDVLQTIGPAPSGENTKRKQSEYNSIGFLTSVCEVTGLSGSGACAQSVSASGYWTQYNYDALGDLTAVTQNAQSSQKQTRSFSYDEMGRMTSETNPETGKITYVYDSDSTCGNSSGDLVKKTDAVGNVSCYAYDALHRVTGITYSGPNSGNTPNKYFVYDAATVNSVAMANAKTRLAEAYTCVSPCSSKLTDEGFSYTVRGEVSDVYESTPHSGGYFHVNETYWANGALDQISGLSGLPTLTYNPDGEGRANTVSASSGQNPVWGTNYNSGSEVTQLNLGSGDSDAFAFDPNTLRMTQYKFNVNNQSVTGNLTWNANGTLGSLNITDPFNAANTQTCAYSHDDLARIASGNCGSIWAQTFSYDAFGNLTKTGSSQFQPGYNWQTNQMSTGASYDANGDVLNDSLHSYAWDALGRPTTIDSVGVTYDALGRMVEQNKSGSYTEIVYDPLGSKLALMSGVSTLKQAFAPLPAGATAVYNASGLQYYRHPDWLGSSRFASTPSRTMYNDLAFAPFGEPYAQAGSSDTSFTGQNQDTTTNLYDFMYREYGIQGRWPSPDPAGLAAANPANPQSWNRYAYVLNNPLSAVDRTGLFCVWDDGSYDAPDDSETGTPDGCRNQGGTWFDGSPGDYGLGGDWSAAPSSLPNGTSLSSIVAADQLEGGGWVTKDTWATILQDAQPYLALQQSGNMANPTNIFELYGLSVATGAGVWGLGIYYEGITGWALANAQNIGDCAVGALSPSPGGPGFWGNTCSLISQTGQWIYTDSNNH